jgi:hypothetical protein
MPRQATGGKIGAPKKTRLSAKQSEGLAIEVQRAKHVSTDGITGSNLARKIGVTRAAVSKWRKDPIYQTFFSKLLGQKWSEILEQNNSGPIGEYWIDPDFKEPEIDPAGTALQVKRRLRKEAYQYLTNSPEIYSLSIYEYVKKTWHAPFEDVESGKHFKDPEQYFAFLTDNLLLPSDNLRLPSELLKQTMERLQKSREK